LFNSGKIGASASASNVDALLANGPTSDLLIADFQEGLTASYVSPWAIGAGGAYGLENQIIHLSAEWYSSIERYDVLEPEPFVGQSTRDTLQLQLIGKTSSVLNVGLGVQHHLSESLDAFFGFNTDFSAAPSEDSVQSIYFTRWDLYHFSSGLQFLFGSAQVTLGLGYVFGSERTTAIPGLEDYIAEQDRAENEEVDLNFNRLKFVVGFGIRS
jgi:hypothetical protein